MLFIINSHRWCVILSSILKTADSVSETISPLTLISSGDKQLKHAPTPSTTSGQGITSSAGGEFTFLFTLSHHLLTEKQILLSNKWVTNMFPFREILYGLQSCTPTPLKFPSCSNVRKEGTRHDEWMNGGVGATLTSSGKAICERDV